MAINFGQKEIKALYKGNQPIKQVYKGTELIYPTGPDFSTLQDLPFKVEGYMTDEALSYLNGDGGITAQGMIRIYSYTDESLSVESERSEWYGFSGGNQVDKIYLYNDSYADSALLYDNDLIKGVYNADKGGYVCHASFTPPDQLGGSSTGMYDVAAGKITVRITKNGQKTSSVACIAYKDKNLTRSCSAEDLVIIPYNDYDGTDKYSSEIYFVVPEKYFDESGKMTEYYISFSLSVYKVMQKTVNISLERIYSNGNTNIMMHIQNFVNIPSWGLDISNVNIYLDVGIENKNTQAYMGNFSLQYNTYGESVSEKDRYSEYTYVGSGSFELNCTEVTDFYVNGPDFSQFYFDNSKSGEGNAHRYVFVWDFYNIQTHY